MIDGSILNLNVRGMKPSATVAINERSAALIEQGIEVYRLGLGQSPFPVPPSVVAALQAHAHRKEYMPVRGLRTLRDTVASFHTRRIASDYTYSGDDVLIGPGSKELMFIVQLAFYGDLVLPSPAWVSYSPQARIIGREVRWVPTHAADGWKLQPEALAALCRQDRGRPRILILNYPSNPTGNTLTVNELAELAEVARDHRVLLISDEIYGELHHTGEHASIARFYPEGTIISSGLSKWCGAGGWRLGTFQFPSELRWLLDAMSAVASETYTSTSAPIQCAAVTAFTCGPEIEAYLVQQRRVLQALGQWCHAKLLAAGVACVAPAGGFYLFPDFASHAEIFAARGLTTSAAMCERLLIDTGVAVLPGSDFGRPETEWTVRLAYVDFDGEAALAAAAAASVIDEAFLQMHTPRVLTAITKICEWLAQGSTGAGTGTNSSQP